jgi:uncharacterized protein YndB with AHSA1/START domain
VDPVSVSITIDRPREEIFAYLRDIANHAEFTDHFLVDWHLTREQSAGQGAGARFRIKSAANPFQRYAWADTTLVSVEEPSRIVEQGRSGKFNRVRVLGVYELEAAPGGNGTRVTFTNQTEPATASDRLLEALGQRGWLKRKNRKALKRLRSILEDGSGRGERVTLAAR